MDQLRETGTQFDGKLDHLEGVETRQADRAADQRTAQRTSRAMVQHQLDDDEDGEEEGELEAEEMVDVAQEGVAGPGGELPHKKKIEKAFGRELGGVKAHVGGPAGDAADEMGAEAFATGDNVAFQQEPDLHTAAHEAAHVVQQEGGVQLLGGVGKAGDAHEREADAVADATVAGQSAAPLLAKYGRGGDSAGGQVQHEKTQKSKNKKSKAPPPKPKGPEPREATEEEFNPYMMEGEDALLGFSETKKNAGLLHNVLVSLANMESVHKQVIEDYDKAKKDLAKTKEKSALEQVLGGIFTLIDLASGVGGIIKLAKTVSAGARGMQTAYALYKMGADMTHAPSKTGQAIKDIGGAVADADLKSTYEAAKGVFSADPVEPDAILADANNAAIVAGHEALLQLQGNQFAYNFSQVSGDHRKAGLDLGQMAKGVQILAKADKVLPSAAIKRIESFTSQCEAMEKEITTTLGKMEATLKAIKGGGAEAIASPVDRSVFEKVQSWKASGDAKFKSIGVAMDQSTKHVTFNGHGIDTGDGALQKLAGVTYSCHRYSEEIGQTQQGTLYISDPNAVAELRPFLIDDMAAMDNWMGTGGAEKEMNALMPGAQKFQVSMSMCKALMSLTDNYYYVDATVHLWKGSTKGGVIVNRHKGPWYEKWWGTPEFEQFWSSSLGREYAFVQEGRGDKKQIPFATKKEVDDSTHVPEPTYGGMM